MVPDKVVVDLNVFGVSMKYRVVGETNYRDIVAIDRCGLRQGYLKFLK